MTQRPASWEETTSHPIKIRDSENDGESSASKEIPNLEVAKHLSFLLYYPA
jgi:hypothetical protein